MRIGICDDERAYAEMLEGKISAFFAQRNYPCEIQLFDSGVSLAESPALFDLVFLDCRLPDMNGLDLARQLLSRETVPTIVFISAFSEYVYESFEVGTFRYLLKSMPEAELFRTLESFLAQFDRDITIGIPTKNGVVPMWLHDVVYIESMLKYSIVRFQNRTDGKYCYCESTHSLAEYSELIRSPRFFRTHKRFLVNMAFIEKIDKNVITLSVGEQVEISRRNLSAFHKAYNLYLKNSI